ncbi:uncharacterized protein [Pocillopora verrucosa]|uniref:uncharacterized protein n=1 Tax=Pocillopora verrucosa TaxID=203993 RepID=UPI003340EEB2
MVSCTVLRCFCLTLMFVLVALASNGCKFPSELENKHKSLKSKFKELKDNLTNTRSAIKAKEKENLLTKKILLEKMQAITTNIVALENDTQDFMDKLENFCDVCPKDRCQSILNRNNNRLERMKEVGDMIKERYDKIDAEESGQKSRRHLASLHMEDLKPLHQASYRTHKTKSQ